MMPEDLQTYLHDHIPLSKAMAVEVVSVTPDSVTLSAPLGPNINHRDTVFGGSASALTILSAWSLLHLRLLAEGIGSRVVIQRNTMDYLAPVLGTFTASSHFDEKVDWSLFTRMLRKRGRARATIHAVLRAGGVEAGRFTGEFVALLNEGAPPGEPAGGD